MALPEWTVLALLSQRPAHGFAVSQLTASDGELGRIWRIPRPVVYRAIGRLVDAGLIAPESVEPGLGPQRTIYSVTPQGREEAERWLSTPVEHVRDIRSHLLIKLALLYRQAAIPPACSGVSEPPSIRLRGPSRPRAPSRMASTRSCWPGAAPRPRPPWASWTRSLPRPRPGAPSAGPPEVWPYLGLSRYAPSTYAHARVLVSFTRTDRGWNRAGSTREGRRRITFS